MSRLSVHQIRSTIAQMEATSAREIAQGRGNTKYALARRARIEAYKAELADKAPECAQADSSQPATPPPPDAPKVITITRTADDYLRDSLRHLLTSYTLCTVLDATWAASREVHIQPPPRPAHNWEGAEDRADARDEAEITRDLAEQQRADSEPQRWENRQ